MKIKNIILLLLLVAVFQSAKAQFYDGSHVTFGKNRVQYNSFLWKYYKFSDYEVYFYKGEKDLAIYTAKYAQQYIDKYQDFFDYHLGQRIEFLVYKTQSDFNQSNIGIDDGETYNIGGVTQIYGRKAFVFFDGNYKHLQEQIKADIIQIIIYQMAYGTNWREIMKNSALLTLPDWYTKGLVSYLSDPWNPEMENQIKDGISTGILLKYNRLDQQQEVVAGHALWYYIGQTYGNSIIPNIVAMTSVSRSIESGFQYVLGMDLKNIIKAYTQFYQKKFAIKPLPKQPAHLTPIKKHFKRHTNYYNVKMSPDGNKIAYVTNKLGRYHIYIYNLVTKKRTKVYVSGHKLNKITDFTYPQLAWHPSGKILAFAQEKKGALLLSFYHLSDKKTSSRAVFNLNKILSMQYAKNGMTMVMSAVENGQSDIYLYNIPANTQEQITKDKYDDLQPYFSDNDKKILFVSDRPNTILKDSVKLKQKQKDANIKIFNTQTNIFEYDIKNKSLRQITKTPGINESQPTANDSLIYYLAPHNGLLNRFIARYDSTISFVDTTVHFRYFYNTQPASNYERNIEDYDINNLSNKLSAILYRNSKYRIYTGSIINKSQEKNGNYIVDSAAARNASGKSNKTLKLQVIPMNRDTLFSTNEIDYHHYMFDAEKRATNISDHTVVISSADTTQKTAPKKVFKLPQMNNYALSFFTDNTTTQVNNEFLNREYQTFNGGPYISPGLGITLKLGVSDVLENYKIYGGVRYSGQNMEYFMAYENLKKKIDKKLWATRTELKQNANNLIYKMYTHTFNYRLKYPFNPVSALAGTITLRNDRLIMKSTDVQTAAFPNQNDNWGRLDLSYTFDNTRFKSLNIRYGTRFKIFGQFFQQLPIVDDLKEKEKNSNYQIPHDNMFVFGFDFRHYQKISRNLIWVTRLSASTSFGKEKIDYYLGGVDDWLILGKQPRFNTNTNIDYSQNYRFQALASPMRGFNQNVRNGNSFAVLNDEIRWPFVKYFSNGPIKSAFFRYLQLIGFGDVGTAWTGLNPYSKSNLTNQEIIDNYPIKVTLYNKVNPIVGGFGFGLRTKMLGYFVRADYAWGVENGIIQKPIFYLSLSLDI